MHPLTHPPTHTRTHTQLVLLTHYTECDGAQCLGLPGAGARAGAGVGVIYQPAHEKVSMPLKTQVFGACPTHGPLIDNATFYTSHSGDSHAIIPIKTPETSEKWPKSARGAPANSPPKRPTQPSGPDNVYLQCSYTPRHINQ